jgi:hypothetical protein
MTQPDTNDEVHIRRVNEEWLCVTDDGELLPVVDWFDEQGDHCVPEDAVACVAGREGYGWITVELEKNFESIH